MSVATMAVTRPRTNQVSSRRRQHSGATGEKSISITRPNVPSGRGRNGPAAGIGNSQELACTLRQRGDQIQDELSLTHDPPLVALVPEQWFVFGVIHEDWSPGSWRRLAEAYVAAPLRAK